MKKTILDIAKRHYLKKDWYTGWGTNTNWQKCIFDAVRELYGSASETYTETTRVLLEAANLKLTKEDEKKLNEKPSSFCLKIIDKYYKNQKFIGALEIE